MAHSRAGGVFASSSLAKSESRRRILIVDDHPVTRAGMRALIETHPGFVVCAEADGAEAAMKIVRESPPDIAIVDLTLAGENGLDLVAQLRATCAALAVLVVSMHDEEFYAARAHRAGARGYVMKEHASSRIIAALSAIAAGQTAFGKYVPPDPQQAAKFKRASGGGGMDTLSARELQVLRLIGDGYATREIAQQLGLSAKTVETHREHLKLKLNLTSGESLIRFAIQWAASSPREAK